MTAKNEMPELKIGSAADYRVAREQAATAPDKIIPVPMPSGFVWGLKRPDLAGFIMTGRMPESLVNEFLASAKRRGKLPQEMTQDDLKNAVEQNEIDPAETINSLIFMRELVRECAAQPRIGIGEGEIPPTEVDPEDFKYIFHWAMSHKGVQGIEALQTFQSRRERRANKSRARRGKLRDKAVPVT